MAFQSRSMSFSKPPPTEESTVVATPIETTESSKSSDELNTELPPATFTRSESNLSNQIKTLQTFQRNQFELFKNMSEAIDRLNDTINAQMDLVRESVNISQDTLLLSRSSNESMLEVGKTLLDLNERIDKIPVPVLPTIPTPLPSPRQAPQPSPKPKSKGPPSMLSRSSSFSKK